MKYSVSSRISSRYLRQADEIKVQYRDKETIPDLYQKYPGKTILLLGSWDIQESDYNDFQIWDKICEHNLIIQCAYRHIAQILKELGLRFMLTYEATSYWNLEGLIALGAEYAYVGVPLFFDLPHSESLNIKLRVVPTVTEVNYFPRDEKYSIVGKWIRPEDIPLYEPYIDIIEFENTNDIKREETLFKVYAINKQWSTNLNILVPDLSSSAVNRLIDPQLAASRISCRQRCMSGGNCRFCHTALTLANPDLFPIEKKAIIEK